MPSWDRRKPQAQAKLRDRLLRDQLRNAVGPLSPYWRERLADLGVRAADIRSAAALRRLPAVGERDVCPNGDPRGAAALVLQADEAGFAVYSKGPEFRRALLRRLAGSASYRRQVEAAVRPTTYHWGGQGLRFPVASTRDDLDLVARAGNRAWQVLGLTGADVLVSAVPVAARLDHLFLTYAALGAGAPALFPGRDLEALVAALHLVPATVLALPARGAAAVLEDLDTAGAELSAVRTLLLVGGPSESERAAALRAWELAGGPDARVLGLYGPPDGRVMWAECRPGSGYHTYPDLDVVGLVDPETAEAVDGSSGGELVVSQLRFRGTALLRWRTADLVPSRLEGGACPACKRTVPRVPSALRRGLLVPRLRLRGQGDVAVDLRAVAAALSGRGDLVDWRVSVGRTGRDRTDELLVAIAPTGQQEAAARAAFEDVRAVAGVPPTRVVVAAPAELAAFPGEGLERATARIAVRG